MTFLAVQSSDGGAGGDRLPILKYDARAGRWSTIDRVQTADGWQSNVNDITFSNPVFAVDFGSLEVGWLLFPKGAAPIFMVVPYGEPIPARPAASGTDEHGKPMNFKSGFRIKVCGKSIGGVRELAANAGVMISGMNDLHTSYEAAPEAAAGKIPLVRMTNTLLVKAGQSSNYQPVFEITGWVDRPAVLGARAVPPPNGKPASNGNNHADRATHVPPPNHVPPPAAVAAATSAGVTPLNDAMPFAPEVR